MVRSGSHVFLLMDNGSMVNVDLKNSSKKSFESSVKQVCPSAVHDPDLLDALINYIRKKAESKKLKKLDDSVDGSRG